MGSINQNPTKIQSKSNAQMTKLYHASPSKNHESIRKNGLKNAQGRFPGKFVYCVFSIEQCHKIGLNHCGGLMDFDIWEITVDQARNPLRVEEHPGWCELHTFKEVLLDESLSGPGSIRFCEDEEVDMTIDDLQKFAKKHLHQDIMHLFDE